MHLCDKKVTVHWIWTCCTRQCSNQEYLMLSGSKNQSTLKEPPQDCSPIRGWLCACVCVQWKCAHKRLFISPWELHFRATNLPSETKTDHRSHCSTTPAKTLLHLLQNLPVEKSKLRQHLPITLEWGTAFSCVWFIIRIRVSQRHARRRVP